MSERKDNIPACYEYVHDGPLPAPEDYLRYFGKAFEIAEREQWSPKTVRELGIPRILLRQVIDWSVHLGSYGTGGQGFLA